MGPDQQVYDAILLGLLGWSVLIALRFSRLRLELYDFRFIGILDAKSLPRLSRMLSSDRGIET